MRKILCIWNARNLSLKGRITIKSLVLPMVIFSLSLIYVPKEVLDRINKILIDFLWRHKMSKIITDLIEDRGLKMADVHK